MENLNWEENRDERKKVALEEHERLHRLFEENRFAFELERKRKIEAIINSSEDAEQRKRLRHVQALWDKRMRGAGSDHNRYVLAQTFFWEHFHEIWHPAIKEAAEKLTEKT